MWPQSQLAEKQKSKLQIDFPTSSSSSFCNVLFTCKVPPLEAGLKLWKTASFGSVSEELFEFSSLKSIYTHSKKHNTLSLSLSLYFLSSISERQLWIEEWKEKRGSKVAKCPIRPSEAYALFFSSTKWPSYPPTVGNPCWAGKSIALIYPWVYNRVNICPTYLLNVFFITPF
jgi:hypothetical protein